MTKRQLLRARRGPRPVKQKRFRGWHWENTLRERRHGERTYVGKCRSKQGIMILVEFHAEPGLIGCCRHCGGQYESVRPR